MPIADPPIGVQIKARRKRAKLSQKYVAEKARIDTATLHRIETGASRHPHADTVAKIAAVLDAATPSVPAGGSAIEMLDGCIAALVQLRAMLGGAD